MPKYRISFRGRTLGAIGIMYPIVAEVEAEDQEKATLRLYDKYEHIQQPIIEEIAKEQAQ